ncbi:MAG: SBBP repeat-containing protein [Bacteroidetes bacterium]|nr:SBBP repeat-containing protein [Bacteroidota bacterium]
MKNFAFTLVTVLVSFGVIAKSNPAILAETIKSHISNSSTGFIENNGQMTDMDGKPVSSVLFKSESPGVNLFITGQGLTFQTLKVEEEQHEEKLFPFERAITSPEDIKGEAKENIKIKWERIDVILKGARIKKENILKEGASTHFNQYFLAHCPEGITDVREYEKLIIKDVYPGIDWVFYNSSKKGFKYDFVVNPGANYKKIELLYQSKNPIEINAEGEIELTTQYGDITENAPISFLNEEKIFTRFSKNYEKEIKIKEDKGYETSISFHLQLSTIDSRSLIVIDPNLMWGSYYGGTSYEGFTSVCTDANSNVFVAGYVASTNFPTQNPGGGAYFQGAKTVLNDICVLKFSNIGVRAWATYYGGSGSDNGYSITTDDNNNVFVTGESFSANFPIFNPGGGTYFQAINAGGNDAFILKFSNTGVRLWASYYGGNFDETGESIKTDGSGNVFITGHTRSTNFPTQNPGGTTWFQAANAGGGIPIDVFIVKCTNAGLLLWSTYYGGTGRDFGMSLVTDGSGNVLITGWTDSPNFPTLNPGGGSYYQAANAGGFSDILILKFTNVGVLLWSTYYGGNALDQGEAITIDGNGNIFIGGNTGSPDFPTLNSGGSSYYQGALGGGWYDLIILKFNNSGALIWATYYGGTGTDSMFGGYERDCQMITDCSGNIYLTGCTTSNNFPTLNPGSGFFVGAYSGGGTYGDVFILQFNNSGVRLWATYNGTSSDDHGNALAVDPTGCLLVVGEWKNTGSNGLTNPGGGAYYDNAWGGSDDSFIMKFSSSNFLSVTAVSTNASCGTNGSAIASATGGISTLTYSWSNGTTGQTATGLAAGNYTVTVTDANSCTITATATATIISPPSLTGQFTKATANCSGCGCKEWIMITASGGTSPYTYTWPDGYDKRYKNHLCPGAYTINIKDKNGCSIDVSLTAP